MRSYNHILAAIDPTDGSAQDVLSAAETLQCAQNVKLTVASSFVRPPVGIVPKTGMGAAEAPIDTGQYVTYPAVDIEHETEKYEKAVREEVEKAGLEADVRVPLGLPGATIPDLAEEIGADLIVIGSHDRGFIETMIRGSVSKRVAGKADCDVLLVAAPAS